MTNWLFLQCLISWSNKIHFTIHWKLIWVGTLWDLFSSISSQACCSSVRPRHPFFFFFGQNMWSLSDHRVEILDFFFFFLAALGLHCCSSCGERGSTPRCDALASHWGGFPCCGARALSVRASVVVPRGLQSAGSVAVAHGPSCSAAFGIFPDQGSNPCPLHWQADS